MGLAEGAEWAGGPKGGGVYPAGRFRVEEIPEQEVAKRPLRPGLSNQRSLPSLGEGTGGDQFLKRMQTSPVLSQANLRKKPSGSNLPKLAWNLDSPTRSPQDRKSVV